ncbi:hypothetical protein GQ44DRAFT_69636 [Phaeosphaeriaceae sp. PMI808]|nr:hypothetical protein GQ44DRAFT_69636 [Phaeosphaeriaceae sp. PMI808]
MSTVPLARHIDGPSAPPKRNYTKNGFWVQLHKGIKDLSIQQEQLSEDRKEVLICRERLVSTAKKVRKGRHRTLDSEARLMDALRVYFNSPGQPPPEELTLAYSQVEEARNNLALLEDEYDEIEQELEILEWTLLEKEDDLYQRDLMQLLPDEDSEEQDGNEEQNAQLDKFTPSPSVQYRVAILQHRKLMTRFNGFRKKNMDSIIEDSKVEIDDNYALCEPNGISDFEEGFSNTLNEMIDCEVKVQLLKAQLVPQKTAFTLTRQIRSEPGDFANHPDRTMQIPARARSDGGLQRPTKSVENASLVEVWLLDCLEKNVTERLLYMGILQKELGFIDEACLEFGYWKERIAEMWPFDMRKPTCCRNGEFLLGKSTSSHITDTTKPVDSTELQSHYETSESALFDDLAESFGGKLGYHDTTAPFAQSEPPRFPIEHLSGNDTTPRFSAEYNETKGGIREFSTEIGSLPVPEVETTAADKSQKSKIEEALPLGYNKPIKSESQYHSVHTFRISEANLRKSPQGAQIENGKERCCWSPNICLHYPSRIGEDGAVIETDWFQKYCENINKGTEEPFIAEYSKEMAQPSGETSLQSNSWFSGPYTGACCVNDDANNAPSETALSQSDSGTYFNDFPFDAIHPNHYASFFTRGRVSRTVYELPIDPTLHSHALD